MANIRFGPYAPDLVTLENPGLTVAKNVLPSGEYYEPFNALEASSDALSTRAQGAIYGQDYDGNSYNFVGSSTKLWLIENGLKEDVSVAGGYTTGADEVWSFTQWGEQILATNFANVIQTFTMGTSTDFANLGGTPPQARYITVVKDFVVVGNTFDGSDGNRPTRVWNSGFGNAASWTVSSTTQANHVDLDTNAGPVKQVVGGEYGVVFQENAITRMTYVGSPVVFQFDQVESNRGTIASGSVVKIGGLIAYLSYDGFYIFNGQNSVPIGHNQIDRFFFSDVDLSYLYRISSVLDPYRRVIYWAYPGQGNTGGNPNRILCYNYSPNATTRWTLIEDIELEILAIVSSTGYTLDTLDTYSTNLDALPFSLDSAFWTGGVVSLAAYDTNHKQAGFTGDGLSARFETGEYQLTENRRTHINRIRPLIEGNCTITAQIGYRQDLCESVTWTPSQSSLSSNRSISIRNNARYQRLRLDVSGTFEKAIGFSVEQAGQSGFR